MRTNNNMLHHIFKHVPVAQELARTPVGKRSVAIARRGTDTHRLYGKHTSHCMVTKKGVHKKAR